MGVCVDKPGEDSRSGEIDNARMVTRMGNNLIMPPDTNDPVLSKRDRLRAGHSGKYSLDQDRLRPVHRALILGQRESRNNG